MALSHPSGIGRLLSGFSMMEILISCVIIGVLALILFPILQSAKPDKNEALHKKSTFVVERIINELSSDNTLYPNNGEYSSLSNTENVMYNNETHGGATKFCTLFASRIKLKPGSEVRCIDGEKSFTSEDGIDWYLPVSDFKSGAETIMVDLNGSEGPNIVGEDRFEYKVQPGFKIPKKEIDESTISVTPTAPTKEDPDKGEKPPIVIKESQAKYSISCTVHGGGQIFGTGDNKVNGNYTLVAVPNPGYKCDWFTKQVTVKDGDVTDCDVTCDPNIVIPKASTSTVTPPPITPPPSGDYCEEHPEDISCICAKNPSDPRCEEEEEEKTYCAYVAWSGDKEYCRDSGKVCGKPGSKYNITISSRNRDYTASWARGQGNGTFGNSDVVLMASCDNKNQCYALNINADSNCPYTLPAGDCPTGEKDKYTSGQKYITVTPKEGYTFNGKTGTVHYPVTVNSTTTEIDLSSLCKAEETEKEIILTPHKEGNKIYVTPSEVVPFPMDVELGYETGEGTGNNWDFTINSNQNKSEEVIDTTFGGASCLCTEEWSLLNPSSTYTHEGITYTIKISNESEPKCSGCGGGGGSGDSCTVNLIGDGGFDGQVNAEVKLSGGASKSVTLSDSNNYRYKWKGLTCGKKYNVSAKAVLSSSANEDAWAEAELTATADPDEFTLQPDKEQDVLVTIKKDIPTACSISVEGTGDTGNGVFANISLSGGTSKSATLDESNMYLVTWSDLACDANYTVSVTKAGEKKNGAETTTKVTATVNPSGSFKIPESGTQDVKVDFKKEEAKQCSITVKGEAPDSALLGRPNNSIQVRIGGLDTKTATLDSSNDYTYTFSGLTCGIVYTVGAEKPVYNTTKINTASYNVSGFRSGTLNGDETSILTLEVIKNAYLYIAPMLGGGAGLNWNWSIQAFTSDDGTNNSGWPFGDDVSSLTVSFFCPTPTEVDAWGNPIQTEFTATFTKSNFYWTSRPFYSSNPPTSCTLTGSPHVDNYVIHVLR